jgi:hypothetical protein
MSKVDRELITKAGIDVKVLIDKLKKAAAAEFTTYYYYTLTIPCSGPTSSGPMESQSRRAPKTPVLRTGSTSKLSCPASTSWAASFTTT